MRVLAGVAPASVWCGVYRDRGIRHVVGAGLSRRGPAVSERESDCTPASGAYYIPGPLYKVPETQQDDTKI